MQLFVAHKVDGWKGNNCVGFVVYKKKCYAFLFFWGNTRYWTYQLHIWIYFKNCLTGCIASYLKHCHMQRDSAVWNLSLYRTGFGACVLFLWVFKNFFASYDLVILIQNWGLFSSLRRLPKNAHQNIVNNLNYLGLMIELEVFPVCSGRSEKTDSWTAAVIQRPKCGPLRF